VKALMNLNLWRETHQAILWGLSRLTDVGRLVWAITACGLCLSWCDLMFSLRSRFNRVQHHPHEGRQVAVYAEGT